ncbi:factor-independent urate hydroxylase [Paenibacillus daejeonensis]|uniref:factor-independent urate hydroxylase n=1 Tax=Paenibacillus daejeonensis TaxID=135193 RepID=UPI00035E39B3|nr:urate oxidase [Paenibacillus daejeonensis]
MIRNGDDWNGLSEVAFVIRFGSLFERSPWVARQAWQERPFHSLSHLFETMAAIVHTAGPEQQLDLLRAHPELGLPAPMTTDSRLEQRGAGLESLEADERLQFERLNHTYRTKFGFPFIVAVRGKTKDQILALLQQRSANSLEDERQTALQEVCRIARLRLEAATKAVISERKGGSSMSANEATPSETRQERATAERMMYYGKGDVWVFRTYGTPLRVQAIPESSYTGSPHTVIGVNIRIAVSGERFLPSFTEGDNSLIVATDSMKNFILRQTALYTGATVDGLLAMISRRLLEKYPQMTGIRMEAEHVPFEAMPVLEDGLQRPSDLVFNYSRNEAPTCMVECIRTGDAIGIAEHTGGLTGLRLLKVKGSSFKGYVWDEYTTLPEASDRPLFIYLQMGWRYTDPEDALEAGRLRYVPAEQVRDIAATVFHALHSPSIQHLIYHIGLRVLERFPQLDKVWFESNNRTWETVTEETANGHGGVFTEPRPPYGFQGFSLTRDDLPVQGEGK